MFESLQERGRLSNLRRMISLLISTAAHGFAIGVVVVIPMIFISVLPEGQLLTLLFAAPPPPPVPPVPAPQEIFEQKGKRPRSISTEGVTHAPGRIPDKIPPPVDEPPVLDGIVAPEWMRNLNSIYAGPVGSLSGVESVFDITDVPAIPPPPSPPPKKEPFPVSGTILRSKLIHKVEPDYPDLAKRARVSGIVILRVQVTEEGMVSEVRVLRGHPLLNQAAVDAVSQWQYSPTLLNGEPMPITGTVTVIFRLN